MKYDIDQAHVQVELANGAVVICRPVPPYTTHDVLKAVPEPSYPYVDIQSAAGGSENRPALRESPEWDKYQAQLREHRLALQQAVIEHELSYGIVAWKFPGMDKFAKMPPDGWEPDEYIRKHCGVADETSQDAWRIQFIKYVLIATDNDDDAINKVIHDVAAPPTAEELKAALRPFESTERTEPQSSQ